MANVFALTCRKLLLIKPESDDLAAHVGVIAAVKVQKRRHVRIAGMVQVGCRKILRLPGIAVIVQIHRQKGHFRRHVAAAETLVEFNAVKNNDVVGDADVLQMQIAVAFPDFVIGHPLFKKGLSDFQKAVHVTFDKIILPGRDRLVAVFFSLRKVFVLIMTDGCK